MKRIIALSCFAAVVLTGCGLIGQKDWVKQIMKLLQRLQKLQLQLLRKQLQRLKLMLRRLQKKQLQTLLLQLQSLTAMCPQAD